MKTGTENSLPRWNLFDAVAFCTGGAYRPPFSPNWVRTEEFLYDQGYSGMEYAIYLRHFSELSFKKGAVFQAANYVGSNKTWDVFTAWKEKRPKEVKQLCIRQRKKYKNFISTGYPINRVLLENIAELAPPVLAEVVIQALNGDVWIKAEILEKYAFKAYMYVLGCPEYLWFCPALERDLKKGEDSELRKSIYASGGVTTPPPAT